MKGGEAKLNDKLIYWDILTLKHLYIGGFIMNKLLKKASAIGAAIIMAATMGLGICQAATNFSCTVTGTGSKTLVTKKTSINSMTLKVNSCKFTSYIITKGKIEYELWSSGYSETRTGTTGTFYFAPLNSSSKTYYLDAQCTDTTSKANISGNYDYA